MIERASPAYFVRLFSRVEDGGFWYLHRRGIDPPRVFEGAHVGVALDVAPLEPRVDTSRWLVDCPFCNGAQLASPSCTVFLCIDCGNGESGGQFLRVGWPSEDDLAAGEAALSARPTPQTRAWYPFRETVGALLAENHIFGALIDTRTGAITGAIAGTDTQKVLTPVEEESALMPAKKRRK